MSKCMLSSGPWAWRFPWKYLVDWKAFDGVVMKSFTLTPKEGNGPYYRTIRPFGSGWVNRVGLRNKGFAEWWLVNDWLSEEKKAKTIPSIAIHSDEKEFDVLAMVRHVCSLGFKPKAIEINPYCPSSDGRGITQSFLNECVKRADGIPLIFKLGPKVSIHRMTEMALNAGFAAIHAFNSYPTEIDGKVWGLSGPKLLGEYVIQVELLKSLFKSAYIIAGGGIYSLEAAKRYINAGADVVSIGSLCMRHPLRANKIAREIGKL